MPCGPARRLAPRKPYMHHLNPPSPARAARVGWSATAVKGEGKLSARLPAGVAFTVIGVVILAFLPSILVSQLNLAPLYAVLLSILVSLVLLVQLPFALSLPRQKAALLKFLERCGPETEILSSKAF